MESYQNYNPYETIEGAARPEELSEVSIGSDIPETRGHVRAVREAIDSDFHREVSPEHEEESTFCRNYGVSIAGVIMLYNCAVCIYGVCIAFNSAILYSEYDDYHYPGTAKNESIPIDSLPGHIDRETSTVAWWLFTTQGLGFVVITNGIINLLAKKRDKFMESTVSANLFIAFGPFYYLLWITIKLRRLLTSDEIQLWNFIDTRFINNMRLCEIMMYIIALPGLIWSMSIIIILCTSIINVIRRFVCCVPSV